MAIAEDLTLDFAAKQWLTQLPLGGGNHRADFPVSIIRKNAHSFAAGTALTFEGDDVATVLCVLKGWLSLSKSLSDGQTQIIDFALSGDIVSPVSADGHTSVLQVEAATDAVVAILTEAEWARLKREWPAIATVSAQLSAAAQARISERMLRLGRGSAPNRIAYSLLELCVRLRSIGQSTNQTFHLPLTQEQLGEFSGLSSVHVCRTLRRMVRNEVIVMEDHMDIHINDLDALAEIAGIDFERLATEITPTAA
ncbi:MAG: Crp/Fnr family transcriptional regulator [Paracoccaceae bacterium]